MSATAPADDEALARALSRGDEDALRGLYRRYAPLVFSVAARALGDGAADEIVQDVFLAIWQKSASFDPARGAFRTWMLGIARNRIANALRSRRARPHGSVEPDDVADDGPAPDEAQWLAHRRAAIRSAVDALPPPERQALSLAFFDELTNQQVAACLDVPLGTTKTRIRIAMRRLAGVLSALVVALAIVWLVRRERSRALEDRALRVVTASDVTPLRLAAADGVSPDAHGTYRARLGSDVAVLTVTSLATPPRGEEHDAWVRYGDRWTWLGVVEPGADARALLVAEVKIAAERPDAIVVTREASRSSEPRGSVVLAWP